MEPVILLIAITAILSGTHIRSKKINLERERMRLMAGGGVIPTMEEPRSKKGIFKRAQEAIPPINLYAKSKDSSEVEELKKRLENIETIVIDSMEGSMVNGTAQQIQRELSEISQRLNKLEK
jgi:tetrahydromethanopterin S-methyltransferase subunit G